MPPAGFEKCGRVGAKTTPEALAKVFQEILAYGQTVLKGLLLGFLKPVQNVGCHLMHPAAAAVLFANE